MNIIQGCISTDYVKELLIGEEALKKEFNLRKDEFSFKTIKQQHLEEYENEGWEKFKELKRDIKVRKTRTLDEKLRNRIWLLFYKMNYKEMNRGSNFRILPLKKHAINLEKQIDVYAKDDETIIITECFTQEKLEKKSLEKELIEFYENRKLLSDPIRKQYGKNFKPKILWFFATENIIWSKEDKQIAKKYKINIITEQDLPYYEKIVSHLGSGAKYQFLAEFLQKQKIPELENTKIPATKGKIGGNVFYSFITTPRHLLKISFVNHRSLNDPDGIPTYQRIVQKTRLNKIGEYIKSGGFFPTNILINFTQKVNFEPVDKDTIADVNHGNLILPATFKSAWIIDGQHRLYGYSNLDDEFLDQNIFVLAFEEMKHEEEAKLFVTINQEQKSVPKTIIDSLEGELKWGSDKASERLGAIATRIIDILGTQLESPLYSRICSEGDKKTITKCLTLPELKNGVRRSKLIGSIKIQDIEAGYLSGENDEETLKKAYKLLIGYFTLIKDSNETMWEAGKLSQVWTNIGIQGLMLLLNSALEYLHERDNCNYSELEDDEILTLLKEFMDPLLEIYRTKNINILENEFKTKHGSGAPKEYFFKLVKVIRTKNKSFLPNGYLEWEEAQSEENIKKADDQVKQLNLDIQKSIFDKLKEIYGEDESEYWEKGISDNNIKMDAYKKQLEDKDNIDNKMPKEHYLDFIQYKKIIEKKDNWKYFKEVFNIRLENESKGKARYLGWMDQLNEIRKIYAHPTEKRTYKIEHYKFLDWISNKIDEKLKKTYE